MSYQFKNIEDKWRKTWEKRQQYRVLEDSSKPKFYVLDMFPYPSGAGLHVGHPLGYIASDIYSRYKTLKGFNVLHPMGYDAYGLPAEQYAILTGQHPAVTTEKNIKRYREQLDKIGFSYDWSREVRTNDPKYYKWTQATFIEMFNHYYDLDQNKAIAIEHLKIAFEKNGNLNLHAANNCEFDFDESSWSKMNQFEQDQILHAYRIAYLADMAVNWCPELGTVLANDEVKDGLSVRGGHPVEQKVMKQWCLRVGAYANRLLDGLKNLDWSESLKEVQRNWIGRSEGAEVLFHVKNESAEPIKIFTTRPDTIFGVTFMVLAPESELVKSLTTKEQQNDISNYLIEANKKTERERISDVKSVSGVFTGSYCINPFTDKEIPVWISDYVLAGYGTGAIMAVPAHDSRDYAFAKKFKIPIIQVLAGGDISQSAYEAKEGTLVNSGFLNGLTGFDAIKKLNNEIEKNKIGNKKINFRLRDAIFSRQRYWGEPFPIYYKDKIAHALEFGQLPLELPDVDSYLPTKEGDPPLGRAKNWNINQEKYPLELNTMPGFAGSSAYYLRYMDPNNEKELVSSKANNYWQNVDLYIGGTEHATGHLVYSRFWNMFLFDLKKVCKEEPFQKLFNQGMIQGRSNFVYRVKGTNKFVSLNLKDHYDVQTIHVDVNIVKNDQLDIEKFKLWRKEFESAEFELESVQDGDSGKKQKKYLCGYAVEKMSKSLFNVVNPDTIVEEYGADTLRLYEMFLGPVEQSKPWNTNGIEGVSRFLTKLWRLIFNEDDQLKLVEQPADKEELKLLHTCIKKVTQDMENFSFNTSISAFMILVNELTKKKCNKSEIFKPLLILMAPFTPHFSEEVWEKLGETASVLTGTWPVFEEKYLIESSYNYPVSFNGKMKFLLEIPLDAKKEDVENLIKNHEKGKEYLNGKTIRKLIFIPKKIINFVIC